MTAASWCIVMTFPTHVKNIFFPPPPFDSPIWLSCIFLTPFHLGVSPTSGWKRTERSNKHFVYLFIFCCTKCVSSTASTSPGRSWFNLSARSKRDSRLSLSFSSFLFSWKFRSKGYPG
jgi:hypothetical protein